MERFAGIAAVDAATPAPDSEWRHAFVSHVCGEWQNLTPQTIGLLADEAWRHPTFAELADDAAAARWLARRSNGAGRC